MTARKKKPFEIKGQYVNFWDNPNTKSLYFGVGRYTPMNFTTKYQVFLSDDLPIDRRLIRYLGKKPCRVRIMIEKVRE